MNTSPTVTLEWVRQEKAKHRQALADLDVVERVILSHTGLASPSTTVSIPTPAGAAFVEQHGGKRRALLAIIAASPDGLTTPETIKRAVELGVMDLSTANVSPKLSESRKQEYLELVDGHRWRITNKGRDFLASKTS